MVGLAARDGDAPPAHPRHRHRRPPGVSPLRPVELARGQLPASDLPRRAAGELRPVPGPELRSRLRRAAALHGVAVPQPRLRAERDRAGLHHPPDAAPRRHRRHAPDEDGAGHPARSLPRARLGLPGLALLAALVDRDRRLEQRPQHDPGARSRGAPALLGGPTAPSSGTGSTGRHANKELLRHTRTILGQPALGKVDGTAAIVGDRGFVFLFNPNARRRARRDRARRHASGSTDDGPLPGEGDCTRSRGA